eukprot:4609948-Amphidinium_carterae.1
MRSPVRPASSGEQPELEQPATNAIEPKEQPFSPEEHQTFDAYSIGQTQVGNGNGWDWQQDAVQQVILS